MQHKLDKPVFNVKQVRLKIKAGETKILRDNERVACKLLVDGQWIEKNAELSYLENMLSKNADELSKCFQTPDLTPDTTL
jgi:hypothetical protein